jgi:hypothetical protein
MELIFTDVRKNEGKEMVFGLSGWEYGWRRWRRG